MPDNPLCPCESGDLFEECCEPYLRGDMPAPSAEKLMRSRYSAYATDNLSYIKATWHTTSCPPDLRLVPGQVWIGLKIKRTDNGRETDDHGTVEFIARSKRNGRAHRLHEVSRFEKIDGRWLYVDGELLKS